MAKHFSLMLHSSYNLNQQSQWSRVQTRHYRDEKSHHVSPGENNIFVFCSHMESHKNISDSKVCWRKTNSLRTSKQLVLKRLNIYFFKGRQCRPRTTFTTEPPNCTVQYWYETPTGNNTWKCKHVTEHSWEKTKKLRQKNQTESWYHWTTTENSKDLQR